jgi:hypothetical protein
MTQVHYYNFLAPSELDPLSKSEILLFSYFLMMLSKYPSIAKLETNIVFFYIQKISLAHNLTMILGKERKKLEK